MLSTINLNRDNSAVFPCILIKITTIIEEIDLHTLAQFYENTSKRFDIMTILQKLPSK